MRDMGGMGMMGFVGSVRGKGNGFVLYGCLLVVFVCAWAATEENGQTPRSMRIQCRDEKGQPVSGIKAMVFDNGSSPFFEAEATPCTIEESRDGWLSFAVDLREDYYFYIGLFHRDHGFLLIPGYSRMPLEQQATLPARAAVRGKVVDVKANPVAEALVWITAIQKESSEFPTASEMETPLIEPFPEARTDASGAFVLDGIDPSLLVRLYVTRPDIGSVIFEDMDSQRVPGRNCTVRPGGPAVTIVLKEGSTIAGKVVREGDDAPLAGVSVTAAFSYLPNRHVKTDATGGFVIEKAGPGNGVLYFDTPGLVGHEVSVDAPNGGALEMPPVRMGKGTRVAGRVFDGASGAPAKAGDVEVYVLDEDYTGHTEGPLALDGTGCFEVWLSPPRLVTIKAEGKRCDVLKEFIEQRLIIAAGHQFEGIEVKTKPYDMLRGVVRDETGRTVADYVIEELPDRVEKGRTGPDGAFSIPYPQDGVHFWNQTRSALLFRGGTPEKRGAAYYEFASPKDIDAAVTVYATASIRGQLVFEANVPEANRGLRMFLNFPGVMGTDGTVTTDASGNFSVSGLIAKQPYSLSVNGPETMDRFYVVDMDGHSPGQITLSPGECRNLGKLKMVELKNPNPFMGR